MFKKNNYYLNGTKSAIIFVNITMKTVNFLETKYLQEMITIFRKL
jgi:hypothetical protein